MLLNDQGVKAASKHASLLIGPHVGHMHFAHLCFCLQTLLDDQGFKAASMRASLLIGPHGGAHALCLLRRVKGFRVSVCRRCWTTRA